MRAAHWNSEAHVLTALPGARCEQDSHAPRRTMRAGRPRRSRVDFFAHRSVLRHQDTPQRGQNTPSPPSGGRTRSAGSRDCGPPLPPPPAGAEHSLPPQREGGLVATGAPSPWERGHRARDRTPPSGAEQSLPHPAGGAGGGLVAPRAPRPRRGRDARAPRRTMNADDSAYPQM